MRMQWATQRFWVWFVAAAVSFAALAPTLAQAFGTTRTAAASALIEVCTEQGLKWVDPATGEPRAAPDDQGALKHLERCPWCLIKAPVSSCTVGLRAVLNDTLRDEAPYLYAHAPRTLFAWSRALTRAPPSFA